MTKPTEQQKVTLRIIAEGLERKLGISLKDRFYWWLVELQLKHKLPMWINHIMWKMREALS